MMTSRRKPWRDCAMVRYTVRWPGAAARKYRVRMRRYSQARRTLAWFCRVWVAGPLAMSTTVCGRPRPATSSTSILNPTDWPAYGGGTGPTRTSLGTARAGGRRTGVVGVVGCSSATVISVGATGIGIGKPGGRAGVKGVVSPDAPPHGDGRVAQGDLRAQLHHPVRRQAEVGSRGPRVARHHREEPLAQPRHPAPARGQQRLTPQEVAGTAGRQVQPRLVHLAQRRGNVGLFHETVLHADAEEALAQRLHLHPLLLRHVRHLLGDDGEKGGLFMQDLVVLQ